MHFSREKIVTIIGAVVVILLQLIVAPYISISSAVPNIIAMYVILCAMAQVDIGIFTFAFIMGLLYNLIGTGPVGAMAFILVVMVFFLSTFFSIATSDSILVSFISIAVFSLAIELIYAIILMICGANFGFFDAFIYRVVPCFIYDMLVGFILYPVVTKIVKTPPAVSVPTQGIR